MDVKLRFNKVLYNYRNCTLIVRPYDLGPKLWFIIYEKGLDRTKKEPSIFLEIQSEHRQMISSKFSKSFKGAGAWWFF